MNYEKAVNDYKAFKVKQSKQKSRGLNDYNVFEALLSRSDEVRLHSRFIYSLINPEGSHYQGALFLELFLDVIGISTFGLNLGSAKVFKEYDNIDLYITDGDKHIIIENKIYAGDQDKQITRYIDKIKKKSDPKNWAEKIVVVYLTLDRSIPSSRSIEGYELQDGMLVESEGDKRIQFHAVHYNKEITNWLRLASREVKNLSNLSQVISQYQDVIAKLYNGYKGKGMSLSDFMGCDINKWEIMYERAKVNQGDVSDSEEKRQMIEEFANKRDEITLERLDIVAEKLFLHISENRSFIERCEVHRKQGKMYSGAVYINFFLKNRVIIQFEYNLQMKLNKLTLQYYQLEKERQQKQQSITPPALPFKPINMIDFLCSEDKQKEWIEWHDVELLDLVDDLIKKVRV